MLVLAFLACSTLSPAQDAPVGVVLQASLAHVRQNALSDGTTVFTGEELSTDVGGSLDLRVANSRFSLAASSRAHFYAGANAAIAELGDGTLTFRREAGAGGVEVVASDVKIVPKGDGPVTGQVTIFSPCKIAVTSVMGALEVTTGKETRTIAEKETYAVLPEMSVLAGRTFLSPDDPGYHESHSHQACAAPDEPQNSARFKKIAFVAGLGLAAALIGTRLGSHSSLESPDKP